MKIRNIELVKILFFNSLLITGVTFSVMLFNIIRPAAVFGNALYISIILLLILIALILFDKKLEKKRLSDYGFQAPKLQQLNFVIYSFLLFFPFAFISRIFTPNFDFWYSDFLSISTLGKFIPFILIHLPLQVVIEEIGIRALFQSRLSKMFGSRAAILTVTLNFVVLHTNVLLMGKFEYQLVMLLAWLAYSFLLSVVFEYTGSIYFAFALHFLIDIVSSVQTFFHVNSMLPYEVALWSCWAVLLIININNVRGLIPKKIKMLVKVGIPSKYQLYLYILSVPYPLFVMMLSTLSIAYLFSALFLVYILVYYLWSAYARGKKIYKQRDKTGLWR